MLLDLRLDLDGQYVIMNALCEKREVITVVVITGLYVPPPASMVVLHKIQTIVANYHTTNINMAGDFNMAPNPSADKLSPGPMTDSALSRGAELYGLHDTWRWKYPHSRQFTCHSATATLSRIDLIYVSNSLLPIVVAVSLLPRGISDHAPVLLDLSTD